MRNLRLLIRKDYYTAFNSYTYLIFFLIFWALLAGFIPYMSTMFFVILMYTLVISLFQSEENELVCNVIGILPIRKSQAVIARYVFGYLVILVGLAVCSLFFAFSLLMFDWSAEFGRLLVAAAFGVLMFSLITPLVYRFGILKMRLIASLIYIGLAVIVTPLLTEFAGAFTGWVVLAAVAGSAVLSLCSLLISLRIVTK